MTVVTAEGLRALAYAQIEYLECTHHVVHFHLLSGEDVVLPFAAGVLCRGSKAAAGRRAFFAAAPLLCGQSGGGAAADGGRAADVQRCAHPPSRADGRVQCAEKPSAAGSTGKMANKKEPLSRLFFRARRSGIRFGFVFLFLVGSIQNTKAQWLAMSMMIFWGEPEG